MVESAPPEETRAAAEALVAAQFRYVLEASAFYQRKFGGPRRLGPADLPHLPFTTKDELRKAQAVDPPFGEVRAAPQERIVRLHATSGTTGRPLAIGFTRPDHELSCEVGARAFYGAGVRDTDVVLHCLNYALYVGGLADHLSIERVGATMVPVGIGQTQRILDLWDDLRPTAIFCTLSYARHLADAVHERGLDPSQLGLRLLVVGGEPGGDIPEVRGALEATWSAPAADTYGLGEVWPTLAGHCEVRDGLHLTGPDAVWVEIVDEQLNPVPMEPGAEGELVYTHLRREATPLVRYRSNDIASVLETPCPCGRRTPRIKLLGRADSMFVVRGVNVFPQAIEAVLAEVLPAHAGLAILLDTEIPAPPVRILVEAGEAGPGDIERLRAAIRTRLQFSSDPELVAPGALRLGTEHKSKRVFRTYLGEWPPGLSSLGGEEGGGHG